MSLNRTGLVIDYKYLLKTIGNNGIRKIKKIFSITTIGHNNSRKTISSFKLHRDGKNKYIILPRFAAPKLQEKKIIPKVKNNLQLGDTIYIKDFTVNLTSNQNIVLDHLVSNIYTKKNIINGTSSTILQMDPGYGKTYLSMGLINYTKKKTFVIVPNTYLLRQWMEILTKAFPSNTIGCYYGAKKMDGDIIVSIVNSALKYTGYDKIGLIIYDEVHMYCSSKFAAIFTKAQSARCLGITATPNDRIDKFDPVAQWALGSVIYADKMKGWNPKNVSFSSKVTRVLYSGPPNYTKMLTAKSGIISVPLMINQLQEDPYRNNLIVAYAIKLYHMGRNVFVFSDRRDHLHTLAIMLQKHNIDFEAPELEDEKQIIKIEENKKLKGIKELMGGSTDEDIKQAKDIGRIIMTTYQYSGTGVSINKMNSMILATPRRSNMKQILGRIYRLTSDPKVIRHIIDIVDNRICLKSQFYSRKKTYINKLYAPIVDTKIKWDKCNNIKEIIHNFPHSVQEQ